MAFTTPTRIRSAAPPPFGRNCASGRVFFRTGPCGGMAEVNRNEKVAQVIAAWKAYRDMLDKTEDRDFKFGVVVSRDGSKVNELALKFATAEVLGV